MKLTFPNPKRAGFCIFLDSICEGEIVAVYGENGPVVFPSRREAELEIVDQLMIRLQEFIKGEREFDDAITVEEYVLPVVIGANGEINPE